MHDSTRHPLFDRLYLWDRMQRVMRAGRWLCLCATVLILLLWIGRTAEWFYINHGVDDPAQLAVLDLPWSIRWTMFAIFWLICLTGLLGCMFMLRRSHAGLLDLSRKVDQASSDTMGHRVQSAFELDDGPAQHSSALNRALRQRAIDSAWVRMQGVRVKEVLALRSMVIAILLVMIMAMVSVWGAFSATRMQITPQLSDGLYVTVQRYAWPWVDYPPWSGRAIPMEHPSARFMRGDIARFVPPLDAEGLTLYITDRWGRSLQPVAMHQELATLKLDELNYYLEWRSERSRSKRIHLQPLDKPIIEAIDLQVRWQPAGTDEDLQWSLAYSPDEALELPTGAELTVRIATRYPHRFMDYPDAEQLTVSLPVKTMSNVEALPIVSAHDTDQRTVLTLRIEAMQPDHWLAAALSKPTRETIAPEDTQASSAPLPPDAIASMASVNAMTQTRIAMIASELQNTSNITASSDAGTPDTTAPDRTASNTFSPGTGSAGDAERGEAEEPRKSENADSDTAQNETVQNTTPPDDAAVLVDNRDVTLVEAPTNPTDGISRQRALDAIPERYALWTLNYLQHRNTSHRVENGSP